MTLPTGLLLLANVLDVVTCGNLFYREPQHNHESRPMAAADLVNQDCVAETGTWGYYRVKSRTLKQDGSPIWYRVVVDGKNLSCECSEYHLRPYTKKIRDLNIGKDLKKKGKPKEPPKPVICQHILSAVMVHAMKITFKEQL